MKNLLGFRLGGLGDLLVVFPSIYLLRRKLSPCSISLVCRKEYGMLLRETGVVDEVIPEDDRSLGPFFSDALNFEKEIKEYLQKFDLIIGWMQKKSALNIVQPWISSKGKIVRLFVYDNHSQEPISKYFFRKTKEWIKDEDKKSLKYSEFLRLPLSLTQKQEGIKLLENQSSSRKEKIVVVHPGSGSREKCWPLAHFLTIAQRLHQRNIKGVMVTGMAEEWVEEEMKKSALPKNWVWLQNPPLLKLAGLLSKVSFYLGNDSGITHLAAACGTEGLALFRKDLEASWKPYGRMTTISGQSLVKIELETVWEALEKRI